MVDRCRCSADLRQRLGRPDGLSRGGRGNLRLLVAVALVEHLGPLLDRVDTERLTLVVRQVLQRQLAGEEVHHRGGEPDLVVVGHPGRLEAHVHELRHVRLERHPVLQPDRHRDGEGIQQPGQGRALLADLDEQLTHPVAGVLPGGDVALGIPDAEADGLRRAGLGELAALRDVDHLGGGRDLGGLGLLLLGHAQRLRHLAVVAVDGDRLDPELPRIEVELLDIGDGRGLRQVHRLGDRTGDERLGGGHHLDVAHVVDRVVAHRALEDLGVLRQQRRRSVDGLVLRDVVDDGLDLLLCVAEVAQRLGHRLVDDLDRRATDHLLHLHQPEVGFDPGGVAVHHQPDGAGRRQHGSLGVAVAVLAAELQCLVPAGPGRAHEVARHRTGVDVVDGLAVLADHPQHRLGGLGVAVVGALDPRELRGGAELARVKGPHNGYAKNAEPMLRVIGKHREAVDDIDPRPVPSDLMGAARASWDEALELGREHGYRNAQASVLAPTGTIGLMMDCDTTGIEPDLGLVKMKKMVGGASIQIVNQTVPQALRHLGYAEEQVEAIIDYIAENKTIHGAQALLPEHTKVFQCAMGDDAIHYMGHVKMMSAAQPFISGAISKTVNLPETATVADVEQLHLDAWKLGVKAIAIYRDNCKVAQPLSVSKKEEAKAPEVASAAEVVHVPQRRKLPKTRPSQTISFRVGDAKGYITAGEYPGDGMGELFVKIGKQGSTLSGLLDAFAISMSIGLQYGVPLAAYVAKFMNMRFEPAGMTDDDEVRFATSVVDFLARKLALEYLPYDEREALGIYTVEERTQMLDQGYGDQEPEVPASPSAEAVRTSEPLPKVSAAAAPVDHDAPMCFDCGIKMIRAGACHVCESCGTTSGCS